MKLKFVSFLLGIFCLASHAADISFEQLGQVYLETNINVIWNVPKNSVPSGLWVYRVVPTEFPASAISNLMAIGSFTEADKRSVPSDPHTLSFASSNGKRTLWIAPDLGYYSYADSEADNMNLPESVPDKRQVFELATNLLSKLDIDLSQLAKKDDQSDLRSYTTHAQALLYKGFNQAAYATNTHMRGIYFVRSINGADFIGTGGRGGCMIEFGHDAKISRITTSWRQLNKYKHYSVATPDVLLKRIEGGNAVYTSSSGNEINWASVKEITINRVRPQYFGQVYSEVQKIVYPLAQIDAVADFGYTNQSFQLYCPILSINSVLKIK